MALCGDLLSNTSQFGWSSVEFPKHSLKFIAILSG